ncbi:SGNH/GDSL hydrolase family protein [Geminicoccus harenae]|uniref:SGNH/GDSL hydrolase family protein n=1 Tax=Geminicoccus harenae TaxID=2498453 RepID=UPI00168B4865|nr:SGNH/GDSL hydrolase family protein [Geminicoccus harenae]
MALRPEDVIDLKSPGDHAGVFNALRPVTRRRPHGFRIQFGRMSLYGNNDMTHQATIELAAPADDVEAIQVIIGNGGGTTGFGVRVCAQSIPNKSDLNGDPGAFVTITGTDIETLGTTPWLAPPPPTPTAQRRAYSLSDWADIPSVARDDGGFGALYVIRCYISSNSPLWFLGQTGDDFTSWAAHPSRMWAMRINSGNCTPDGGTPSNFVSSTNVSRSPILGIRYRRRTGKVITLMNQGDSIDESQGAGLTRQCEGWMFKAAQQLQAQYPAYAFEVANTAWSGSTYRSFGRRLGDVLGAGLVPDVMVFPCGSPNDPPDPPALITKAITGRAEGYMSEMLRLCRQYETRPMIRSWLPTDTTVHDWNGTDAERRRWNAECKARPDFDFLDFSSVSDGAIDGDGQVPYANGFTTDGIHPNDAGVTAMAPLAAAKIAEVLRL